MAEYKPGEEGEFRDDASLNQLLMLANMESYNALLIEQGKLQPEQLLALRELAIQQLEILVKVNMEELPESQK